ncbi:class I SAM-dependent methyltransferase [Tunicatimonas pelagia]|uniref:class I SAM-dependent methyltransferase n=1 Tax=Tunicatimonas pelagia TaxID=931531 RepID=UPI002665ED92|nr:class I SAM-dependent methyltransferase [Tunicatimonas pelagia]WKN41945.1 class I SAM-dependent methyltransferase [Tunicatimonas pelagia]
MNYEDNPKSIKYYVKKYLLQHPNDFKDKIVVDLPAGNGVTSRIAQSIGAQVYPFDLFPEYFDVEGLNCKRVNINEKVELSDSFADWIICQEGIEHFTDQFHALREFSRVLKTGGRMIITTPNYSNLRSRLSYFLSECERYNKIMPPNEMDSVWMSQQHITNEIYFGHIFLIGIQKLRTLAALAGFKIVDIVFTRSRPTSTLLLPFFYPFIYLSTYLNYRRNMRKNKDYDLQTKTSIYKEQFKLATSLNTLLDSHLFVIFEKEKSHSEVSGYLKSKHKEFGVT